MASVIEAFLDRCLAARYARQGNASLGGRDMIAAALAFAKPDGFVQRTVKCQMCHCRFESSDLYQVDGCGHKSACYRCVQEWVSLRVQQGVLPRCPVQASIDSRDSCGFILRTTTVEELLVGQETALAAYRRLRSSPDAEQRPPCPHPPGAHSQTMGCDVFEARQHRSRVLEVAVASRQTKPCPRCHAPSFKRGESNHKECGSCNTSFCWLCERDFPAADQPSHFSVWEWNGCPEAQFGERVNRLKVYGMRTMFALFLALTGPPAAALTLVTLPAVLCLEGGACKGIVYLWSFWAYATWVLFLTVLSLPLVAVGIVVFLAFLPYILIDRCFKEQRRAREAQAADRERALLQVVTVPQAPPQH